MGAIEALVETLRASSKAHGQMQNKSSGLLVWGATALCALLMDERNRCVFSEAKGPQALVGSGGGVRGAGGQGESWWVGAGLGWRGVGGLYGLVTEPDAKLGCGAVFYAEAPKPEPEAPQHRWRCLQSYLRRPPTLRPLTWTGMKLWP